MTIKLTHRKNCFLFRAGIDINIDSGTDIDTDTGNIFLNEFNSIPYLY